MTSSFGKYESIELVSQNNNELLWLYLNKPQSANSFNDRLVEDLNNVLDLLDTPTSKVKVVIIRGRGKVFSAGADIKAMSKVADPMKVWADYPMHKQQRVAQIIVKIRRCPQVFIAAINGAAAGAGFSLALACDLRVGLRSVKMNCAYINLGLSGCEMGSSYWLPKIVGEARAAELMYTGRFVDGETAFKIGLLNNVVADESALDTTVTTLAEEICEKSTLQLRLTKEGINASHSLTLEQSRHLEDRNQIICMKDEESMIGGAKYAMAVLQKTREQKFIAKL